jgi:uncharacterized SAM-binding protein YcdF (DUF218 family)
MFLLKKIISALISPLTVCLIIQLLGLLLLWFSQKRRIGLILVTIGILIMSLLSFQPIPNALLGFLEHKHPAILMKESFKTSTVVVEQIPKWIVVLGGGTDSDPSLPANSQLSSGSVVRLIEAIRIHRMYPQAKILIAGGALYDRYADSEVMAKVAYELGVTKENIVLISDAKDTKDQACQVKSIIGKDLHIIVTSASHMPRAVTLFRKLGMSPIPAPTDFWVKRKETIAPGNFFPSAISLRKLEKAFHEYIGIIWAKIRNQI